MTFVSILVVRSILFYFCWQVLIGFLMIKIVALVKLNSRGYMKTDITYFFSLSQACIVQSMITTYIHILWYKKYIMPIALSVITYFFHHCIVLGTFWKNYTEWTSNVVPVEIVRRPPGDPPETPRGGLRIFWLNHWQIQRKISKKNKKK